LPIIKIPFQKNRFTTYIIEIRARLNAQKSIVWQFKYCDILRLHFNSLSMKKSNSGTYPRHYKEKLFAKKIFCESFVKMFFCIAKKFCKGKEVLQRQRSFAKAKKF